MQIAIFRETSLLFPKYLPMRQALPDLFPSPRKPAHLTNPETFAAALQPVLCHPSQALIIPHMPVRYMPMQTSTPMLTTAVTTAK